MVVGFSSQAISAQRCIVTTERDARAVLTSLRGYVERVYGSADSNCPAQGLDVDYFDQVIVFGTEEWTANDVETITLGATSITLDNSTKELAIGNWSPVNYSSSADMDTAARGNQDYSDAYKARYNAEYGQVTIDATAIATGTSPFICADGTANVWLRNLKLKIHGVSNWNQFKTLENTACLQNGGGLVFVNAGGSLPSPDDDDDTPPDNPPPPACRPVHEIRGDGIDNDCDPATPDIQNRPVNDPSTCPSSDGFTLPVLPDADGDGYTNHRVNIQYVCPGAPFPAHFLVVMEGSESPSNTAESRLSKGADCLDVDGDHPRGTARNVNPGHREVPGNSLDDNCNGRVDERSGGVYVNPGSGGYGPEDVMVVIGDVLRPGGGVVVLPPPPPDGGDPTVDFDDDGYTDDVDCDDHNSDIHPDAEEICNDVDDSTGRSIDNNCDGAANCSDHGSCDSAPICQGGGPDPDGPDGPGVTPGDEDLDTDGYSPNAGDCKDDDPTIHPDLVDLCDGIDNNCDQGVDDEKSCNGDAEKDNDEDGFCEDPFFCADNTTPADCDDNDKNRYPGAQEICEDRTDSNCNGLDETEASNDPEDLVPACLVGEPEPKGSKASGGCSCDLTGSSRTNPASAMALAFLILAPGLVVGRLRMKGVK